MQYSNEAARPGDGMMIYKRAIAKLRGQEWSAIAIELAIVVVGVFMGTWVANGEKRGQVHLFRFAARPLVGLPSGATLTTAPAGIAT